MRDTSKECSAIFWRSAGKEGRGQGTPRQQDLEPNETTHRQENHTGQMGIQSKFGTQWSSGEDKARYVAKGFEQVEGLDYFGTFAPTFKPETFRFLLQLSAKQAHVMHQFDVITAFLHSPIEEESYLQKPQEFVKQRSDGSS